MSSRTRILFHYLIPAILTNVCVFLFGIIDGIFVGNGVGTDALGAVNIVWPFVMIAYGLTVLTSIGGATIAAIRIGNSKEKSANEVFIQSLYLAVFFALIMMISGTLFTRQIARILGANNTYEQLVCDYLFWYALFAIPNAMGVTLEHFCRNDGAPGLVALTTFISTSCNIFLDWLFVFPLRMGISGAAIATGLSELLRFIIISFHFLLRRGVLYFKINPLDLDLMKRIMVRGTPEMIAQFASPVTILCMNNMLNESYGDLGINAYAIICYVASFALAIMYGCSEGLQPLFGQRYGARNERDLKFFLRSGLIIVTIGSALCVILTNIFSRQICLLYGTNQITADAVAEYMPEFSWGFVIAGVNSLISAYLYSTQRSGEATILNVSRSFILNSACIVGLPLLLGFSILWYCYGISEILVLILGIGMILYSERNGIVYKALEE